MPTFPSQSRPKIYFLDVPVMFFHLLFSSLRPTGTGEVGISDKTLQILQKMQSPQHTHYAEYAHVKAIVDFARKQLSTVVFLINSITIVLVFTYLLLTDSVND